MLGLVLVVALAQCSKDTDCKGERVCTAGECVGAAPVAALPADAPTLRPADALRAQKLRQEVFALRTELEDATIWQPIVRLTLGGVLLAVSALLFAVPNGGNGGSGVSTISVVGLVAGGALFLWGAIQLPMRMRARATLPAEIDEKEAEIHALEGR